MPSRVWVWMTRGPVLTVERETDGGGEASREGADEAGAVLQTESAAVSGRAHPVRVLVVGAGDCGGRGGLPQHLGQQAPGDSAQMREPQRGRFACILLGLIGKHAADE